LCQIKKKGAIQGWLAEGNTKQLIERTGILDISYLAPHWYPNPYSLDPALERALRRRLALNMNSEERKYGTIKFSPLQRHNTTNLFYGYIWKDLIFIPEVPRIENGLLINPMDDTGKYLGYIHMRSSLNRIPPQWEFFIHI